MNWIPEDIDDEPDLTPMIDIVFLLIVFFMTVASVASAELMEIDVPVADQSVVPEHRENRDIISLLPDGSIFFGSSSISLHELKSEVSEGKKARPDYQVLLRVDAKTPFMHTREVMQACASVGVLDIIYTTYQSDV